MVDNWLPLLIKFKVCSFRKFYWVSWHLTLYSWAILVWYDTTTFALVPNMPRTMQELLQDFQNILNSFNEHEKILEERRLSMTYFSLWKSKSDVADDQTKNSNLKRLRMNLKNDFDVFCDKEIESIKTCCKNSTAEILSSWWHPFKIVFCSTDNEMNLKC